MKVLFLEYNSYPIPDAVGNCARHLRDEMARQGVASDVLTFRWDRTLADVQEDGCGTVYLADTWMVHARVSRDAAGKITGSRAFLARAVLTKALAFLCGGLYVLEDKLPAAACKRLGQTLAALCRQNRYDWVIACGSPFCMFWTAARYTPPQTKLLLYYFDPLYCAASGFSKRPARLRARLKKELAAWSRADLVAIAPDHLNSVARPDFDCVRDKIFALTFPNMEIPGETVEGRCPVDFDPAAINCVFLGTLYENNREPEPLLRLFAGMVALEPRLRLYLIGDKFGARIGRQLEQYAGVLGERLVCMRAIPMSDGVLVQQQADILINIGNVDQSCLPSKLFDLIATGKPILQLCQLHICNTLPFIERYPRHCVCFSDETDRPDVARAAAAFCVSQAGQVCPTDQLLERYRGYTTHDITEQLLARLRGVLPEPVPPA